MTNTNADKYRAHARHCVIKALTEGKLSWLRMAQTWLGMIPDAQRTAADAFEASAFEIAALDSLGGDSAADNVTDERDVGSTRKSPNVLEVALASRSLS